MSVHSEITEVISRVICENGHVDTLSPTHVALMVVEHFGKPESAHISHLSLEQAKQMARTHLRRKFEADGDQNEAHQGDMFSGLLQERYPIPVPRGSEPQYKYLRLMTRDELDWNIAQLMKSADARVQHARALQAHRDMQHSSAA